MACGNGYLTVETFISIHPKTKKVLNGRSRALGITSVPAINKTTGEMYEMFMYNETAQRFILDNLYKIIGKA